jgi:ribonuclease G
MRKEIVVNVGLGETRAGVLEDRRLIELYVERDNSERIVGNIYKGRVENVLPGMQAAFVDIGLDRNAFLYVDDATAYKNVQREPDEPIERPRFQSIRDLLRPRQEIVVQVTKEPIGSKGARVITHVSLPGRYLVLMPTVEYIGISRRITDEQERARLKSIAKKVRPKGMGLIVRTVAEGQDEIELAADSRFLTRVWENLQRLAKKTSAPSLLHKDYDLVYRLVRDMFGADVDKFVIDSPAHKTIRALS